MPAPLEGLFARADRPLLALAAIDRIPAMIAFWDQEEICRFANQAYLDWFGRSREDLIGTTLRELLGPIYPLNLPYIRAALSGEEQQFERQIPRPDGSGVRESIATYMERFMASSCTWRIPRRSSSGSANWRGSSRTGTRRWLKCGRCAAC